jgi:hypothetical protein
MGEGMDGKGFWNIDDVTFIDLSPWHPKEWETALLLRVNE